MTDELKKIESVFSNKIEKLENAKTTLKDEFLGIDKVIDELIENVRSWYTLSTMQDKPCVVNLWGLTGVGKTSLLLRLLELIDFEDKTYRFDLGEKEGGMSFRSSLTELCDNKDTSAIAIILDEFQHSRTVSGPFRTEISNDKNRMVWELIDSGKISYINWKRRLWSFEEYILKLTKLVKVGVDVANGIIVRGEELYSKEIDSHIIEDDKPLCFVSDIEYDTIIELAGKELKLSLRKDVEKLLMKMDGPETVDFLNKVLNIGKKPSIKNFTKSIIFVVGNIDEAYTMSSNYTADISADEFYEMSLKITIPDMKNALRNRFRDEQIARLGNIHIIYPALNSSAYTGIIKLELDKLAVKVKRKFNITLEFENSIISEIFKEGVYPTQGVRPIFTTIHQMIKSKLSLHVHLILLNKLTVNKLVLKVDSGCLICQFYQNDTLEHSHSGIITSNLEKLRKPKKDEFQTIIAVHESGHAVLSIALLNTVPEFIMSVTSDSKTGGFMYAKQKEKFISKSKVIARVAVLLGGLVAEEVIFGEDNITSGAASDIERATNFISQLYKENGFGDIPIRFTFNQNDIYENNYHQVQQIEEQIKKIIITAKKLATKTLKSEIKLLLALSNKLATEPSIKKKELIEAIITYSDSKHLEQKRERFYRNKLQQFISTDNILNEIQLSNPIILNKENE